MKVVSKLPHSAQRGDGGKRNTPQSVHFWMRSSWTRAPSQKYWLSRLIAGRGRFAGSGSRIGGPSAAAAERPLPGRNLRTRNRTEPTTSSPTRYVSRLVTKCPTPRPVCFSSLTSSSVRVLCTHSPGTSERANSSSELTATVEVKPCASRRSSAALCGLSGSRFWWRPGLSQTSSIAGGATMCPNADAAAADSSV